jgi:cytoskeletal protein CcmA (bactofilin family)
MPMPPSVPAAPVRPEPAPQVSQAVIGSSMRIKGDIQSREPLVVNGEVEGSVQLVHSLTIGRTGKVKANIKANDVTIFGSVEGNVEVNGKIAIRENGTLRGDIRSAGIVIEDGAYFKGSIDIIRPEGSKPGKPDEQNGAKPVEKAKQAVGVR